MALNLKYLRKELDFTEAAGVVYGCYENYIVTFSLKNKEVEVFVDAKVDPSDTEVVERLRAFIQNNANGYKITASSLSNTGVSMTVRVRDQEVILELFYLLINQLKVLKVSGADRCANCGEEIPDKRKLVKIGAHVHACDAECATRIMSSDKAKAARTKVSKRGFPGFIGALLFSLVAAIPYFLLGYHGMTCHYAAILIPIACGVGFFLFGGKRGWAKLVTCILLPVLVFAAAAVVTLGYTYYRLLLSQGYVVSIIEISDQIIEAVSPNAELFTVMIQRQLLFGAIFLAIGWLFTVPTAYQRPDPYFALLKDTAK